MNNTNIIIYQTQDGQTKIEIKLVEITFMKKIWISDFSTKYINKATKK